MRLLGASAPNKRNGRIIGAVSAAAPIDIVRQNSRRDGVRLADLVTPVGWGSSRGSIGVGIFMTACREKKQILSGFQLGRSRQRAHWADRSLQRRHGSTMTAEMRA